MSSYGVSAVGGIMIVDNRSILEMVRLATSLSAGDGMLVSHEEKDELLDTLHEYFLRSGAIMEKEIPRKTD